jgi:hypothetical protein
MHDAAFWWNSDRATEDSGVRRRSPYDTYSFSFSRPVH